MASAAGGKNVSLGYVGYLEVFELKLVLSKLCCCSVFFMLIS